MSIDNLHIMLYDDIGVVYAVDFIGGDNMIPRLEIPDKKNRFYIPRTAGGLNPCIQRPSGSSLQFANCVFYAVGRFAELWSIWLPSADAERYVMLGKQKGFIVSQTPAAGSIAVWSKGSESTSSDGCGHVAIVEIVNENGSIVTSESGWSAKKAFWTTTRKAGGNWGQSSDYRFLGFVLPFGSIKKGDRGAVVKELQTLLARAGYLRENEIDGDFGKITLGALCGFQLENKLTVDGVVGAQTAAKIWR